MRQHQPKWRTLILLLVMASTVLSVTIYLSIGAMSWSAIVGALAKVGTVGFISFLLWEFFRKSMWRWRCFRGWLVDIPDLSGNWRCEITSNFMDPSTGERIPKMRAMCEIRQRFTSVNVLFKTDNESSRSYSVVASFATDEEAERCRLVYTYRNEPRRAGSDLDDHFGTVILELESPDKMSGFYMNDRQYQGKGDIMLIREQDS